jgi:hypothetical protein
VAKIILSLLLVFAVALTGCKSPAEKKKAKQAALEKKTQAKLREENTDVDFQAYVGRLRKAVAARDRATLQSMMVPDFAYVLGATPGQDRKGEGVFQYWDEQGLWTELDGILSEKFVSKGDFMVAPPQFAVDELQYDGYRAGLRQINGSWKFVYFVTGSTAQ